MCTMVAIASILSLLIDSAGSGSSLVDEFDAEVSVAWPVASVADVGVCVAARLL